MIQIRFFRDSRRGTVGMEMEGHAGAAPRGADLICASATMLAYTAAQSVQELWETGCLREQPEILLAEGKARIAAIPGEDCSPRLGDVLWTLRCGARLLAHNYPQYVSCAVDR